MKLINANSLFYLLFLSFSACTYIDESTLYSGNWKYISVIRNDSSIIEIEDADYFNLNADSSFEYSLANVNKHMQGSWSVDKHVLKLKYSNPDTIRNFDVDVISKYHMQFHEGNTFFDFKRANTD